MFYCGERPWHKKGTKLSEAATAEQAILAGGLDWEVDMIPIQTVEDPPTQTDRRMAVVRTDRKPGDLRRVLGVVHPDFEPLQNRDGVMVFDKLVGKGKGVYHTGGYLGKGEAVWLLAALPPELRIVVDRDDELDTYMLFSNSHDGTLAIDFRITTVRVVCQNTLSLALTQKPFSHVFRHAHDIDPESLEIETQQFFAVCRAATNLLQQEFRAMHAVRLEHRQFPTFVEQLLPFPRPPARVATDPVLRRSHETRCANITKERGKVVDVFTTGINNGIKIPPGEETVWGALNAVTAYVDHIQSIGGDRYAHILFGNGAVLKRSAYELALQQLPKN